MRGEPDQYRFQSTEGVAFPYPPKAVLEHNTEIGLSWPNEAVNPYKKKGTPLKTGAPPRATTCFL